VRRTTTTLLAGLLLVLAGWVFAAPASACSCVGGTTEEFFARADAVFTGTLVRRNPPRRDGQFGSSTDPALHVFAVDSAFKGTVHTEQGVLSPDSGASCGLELSGAGPFVVFATRSTDLGGSSFATLTDGQYAAFLCGGTAPLTPAVEAELQALGPAAAPTSPGEPAAEASGSARDPRPGVSGTDLAGSGVPLPAVVGGGLAVLALAGLMIRRRRTSTRSRPDAHEPR
jgi:hypothetical protein